MHFRVGDDLNEERTSHRQRSHRGAAGPTQRFLYFVVSSFAFLICGPAVAATTCLAERDTPLVPKDQALCSALEEAVRKPSALPLNVYEEKLGTFLRNFCYRDEAAGWKSDKHIRDTGPFVGVFQNGKWIPKYFGTHAPVVTWYSPDMIAWLKANRPETETAPAKETPIPDGAIMIKEMYPPPTSHCMKTDVRRLFPMKGAAIMVRAADASYDGWFWGWFGWHQSVPDWPATAGNAYPAMGFGLYCTNCHASARANQTFASLRNIEGEPGEPLAFLSQDFFLDENFQDSSRRSVNRAAVNALTSFKTHHELAAEARTPVMPWRRARPYNSTVTKLLRFLGTTPTDSNVPSLPSETYDHVWFPAGEPTAQSRFVTSDQCLGCHSAGGTGLHLHMTEPDKGEKLVNISPYGTWRNSPMGMSGRDPVFFAQLASETETFHPESSEFLQDTCLGCHAVQGQRQHHIDRHAKAGTCDAFLRSTMDAVPYPADNPAHALAHYAALARDGVSCTTCHSMVLGKTTMDKVKSEPQNACVLERQESLNPGLTGLASTFTGAFLVASSDKVFGPFEDPKDKPMTHATGVVPEHNEWTKSSELCASCHTVHLPILHRGKVLGRTYEQATYPEWAFSAYRTGSTTDGPLPLGAGAKAETCQGCHMPNKDARGRPYTSKIASIQEYSNFPQAEHTLPPDDIDLPEREGFAKHTLLGLNAFFIKMAQQFPDVLGLRTEDPMLTASKGTPALTTTEKAILDQAAKRTAEIGIEDVSRDGNTLRAKVKVTNKTGHKFPTGVGFRRAFIQFDVLDADGQAIWSSGRTDGAGVIVDTQGTPVAGELWWQPDCSSRLDPGARKHQPHYQVVTRQDQAQIYQELVAEPADTESPICSAHATPEGQLTTSFLSICAKVKDNRLLPHGFLPLADRTEIATALGAQPDLAEDVAPVAVGADPDYETGGSDEILYSVPLDELSGEAKSVRATLYYQSVPPYYLQDRFCTSASDDTKRLYYLVGKLGLTREPLKDWKLKIGQSPESVVP